MVVSLHQIYPSVSIATAKCSRLNGAHRHELNSSLISERREISQGGNGSPVVDVGVVPVSAGSPDSESDSPS